MREMSEGMSMAKSVVKRPEQKGMKERKGGCRKSRQQRSRILLISHHAHNVHHRGVCAIRSSDVNLKGN